MGVLKRIKLSDCLSPPEQKKKRIRLTRLDEGSAPDEKQPIDLSRQKSTFEIDEINYHVLYESFTVFEPPPTTRRVAIIRLTDRVVDRGVCLLMLS